MTQILISAGNQFISFYSKEFCNFLKFFRSSLLKTPLMQILTHLIHILLSCGRHTCMSQGRIVRTCPRHCSITSEALMSAAVQHLAPASSVAGSAPCSSWTNSPKLLGRTGLHEQILVHEILCSSSCGLGLRFAAHSCFMCSIARRSGVRKSTNCLTLICYRVALHMDTSSVGLTGTY